MAARFFLVLCASALLVQSIAASSCGCGSWNAASAEIASADIAAADIAAAEIAAAENFRRISYASAPIYAAPACASAVRAYAPAAPAYAPAPYSGPAYAAKSGGSFGVSVASPYAPSGVSVLSENAIEGALEVAGSLPLLAGVAFEGALPSAGAAGTAYSCGCGDVAISAESLAANAISTGNEAPRLYTRTEKYARPACGCY